MIFDNISVFIDVEGTVTFCICFVRVVRGLEEFSGSVVNFTVVTAAVDVAIGVVGDGVTLVVGVVSKLCRYRVFSM